jgi:hypothetical protein
MRLTRAKKRALAVAAALSMVLLPAPPASANTVAVTTTGGTLTLAGNIFDLTPGGGGTPPCSEKADAQTITFNAGGTGTRAGTESTMFQLAGQWYQADYTILTGAFIWTTTGTGPPTWTATMVSAAPNHLIWQARVYQIPSCAKTDLACVMTVKMTWNATVTSPTALPTYTPGGITLNAASVAPHIAVASCSAPFPSWAGQAASISGLTLV